MHGNVVKYLQAFFSKRHESINFKLTLVEKRASIHPVSLQTIRSATNMNISLGSNENVGREALVPVQMGVLVPVLATNRD
jgi:hypothetical protein